VVLKILPQDQWPKWAVDIKIQKQLVDKDPGNALWLSYVAPDYRALGDLLKSDADLAGAITQYLNEVEIRQRLVNKDPNNEQWQRNLQSSKRRIESLRALEDGVGPPQPP